MASDLKTGDRVNWTFYKSLPLRFPLILLCILTIVWLGIHIFLSLETSPCILNPVPDVLSFEDPTELDYFEVSKTSYFATSSRHYKDGYHSLVWRWMPGGSLALPLGRRLSGNGVGLKVWIYRNQTSDANLTISLFDSTAATSTGIIIRFNFSLNFEGWRAAWVAIHEAKSLPRNPGYDRVQFQAPRASVASDVIFLDLLCLSKRVSKQSRDAIVPPIGGRSIYTSTNLWQQVYKWSRELPPPVDGTTPLTGSERERLRNASVVEKRLLNWFANESLGPSHYRGDLRKRWELVAGGFRKARQRIRMLNVTSSELGVLTGSPLFARQSEFGYSTKVGGNRKLGWVMREILFPLSLEYYFSTKPQYMDDQVEGELENTNNAERRGAAVERLTKGDDILGRVMFAELSGFRKTPVSARDFRDILHRVNEVKLSAILQLLDYITDQGWAEGSAFGSMDHEMNKAGYGFVHSLFLLKPILAQKGRLRALLKTMRWYNEFGEMYQTNFEFNGTSADRMRTIMLYRLETVLVSPTMTIKEQREKLRDMAAYSRWCDNALRLNTAFEGVIKPDTSCFHHLSVYGPAYSPGALTVAALVHYLLDGTSYSLHSNSRRNIRRSLDSYQIMAVRYSLPNSISGRFPDYSKATLIVMLPAYSFLSAGRQYLSPDGTLQGVSLGKDEGMVRAFLRLYQRHYPKVEEYLKSGHGHADVYLSSIGSLETMEAIYSKAKEANMTAARSPVGHWVRNYAALSIHRRRDWAVTVKGFSRYVWDFETSSTENRYGLYQSHGALQISNSEESLGAYDVEKGWDWARIPGTTTVKMDLEQMIICRFARYYQQSKLVGGVVLVSKDAKLANGMFAMRFRQPRYDMQSPTYKSDIEFHFRKTVFFYGSLVVCLGTDISVKGSHPNRTETTLFQNKLVKPSSSSTIYLNGATKWLRHDMRMRVNASAAMLDTNGNGYYVPGGSSLNVEIKEQSSRTSSGLETSSARYATAWLNHGIDPSKVAYEYAILVATDVAGIEALRSAQGSMSPRYEVLQKTPEAHVVRFTDIGNSSTELYGYAFFDAETHTGGPVQRASAECILMAEIDGPRFSNINLSVSSPDLNFNTSKVLNFSNDNGVNEYFYMRSQPVEVEVELREPVLLEVRRVLVNQKVVSKSKVGGYVVVEPDDVLQPSLGGRRVVFKRLVDGESVEAQLVARSDSGA